MAHKTSPQVWVYDLFKGIVSLLLAILIVILLLR